MTKRRSTAFAGMNTLVYAIALLSLSPISARALHKCIDESGKTRYQQYTCSTDVEADPSAPPLAPAQINARANVKIFELELTDEKILYVPLPSDWDVQISHGKEGTAAMLTASSLKDDGTVFYVSAFQRPADPASRGTQEIFDEITGRVPDYFLKKPSSRLLLSGPLDLEIEDGLAHLFTFKDDALAKASTLPAGASIYVMVPYAIVDNISINATLLTNDVTSESVEQALLGFTYLDVVVNQKDDPPPVGFKWSKAPEIKGGFLKPLGWFFKKVKDEKNHAYFVTKEDIDALGTFFTGLTVNVLEDIEGSMGLRGDLFAKKFIDEAIVDTEVLKKPWSHSMGPFTSRGVVTKNKSRDKGDFNTHRLVIANSLTGTVYLVVFEAPSDEWDATWRKYGKVMLGKLLIDSDI